MLATIHTLSYNVLMFWDNQPISFLQGLGLLFLGLKLTGFIDWTWLWVLSPLWIRYAGIVLFWLIVDGMIKDWQRKMLSNLKDMDQPNES